MKRFYSLLLLLTMVPYAFAAERVKLSDGDLARLLPPTEASRTAVSKLAIAQQSLRRASDQFQAALQAVKDAEKDRASLLTELRSAAGIADDCVFDLSAWVCPDGPQEANKER